MKKNCITDIEGVLVGQITDEKNLTGCTVVLIPAGAVCGVDVCGGAPGSRESSLLKSEKVNSCVHALFLSGGSAYGLSVGDGIMRYLEEKNIGVDTGFVKVPIVAGSVIFDLSIGSSKIRPNSDMGYKACIVASTDKIKEGNAGVGTGATVGKAIDNDSIMKGGIGSASFIGDNGLIVAAIVCVNAFGDIRHQETGEILAGPLVDNIPQDTTKLIKENLKRKYQYKMDNTTIAIVGTNAKLSKKECNALAKIATHGLVRTIYPVSTTLDGDTVYTFSKGEIECDFNTVGVLSSSVVAQAVNNAVMKADKVGEIESYKSLNNKKEKPSEGFWDNKISLL